jgi:predicted regulator of Ras-like GTPase activity (Roadblock/LC7/MglB family)
MDTDLAKTVTDLVQAVRDGRGALLMALDGVPVERVASAAGVDFEAIAGEYAGLLRQAQALSAELDCGAPIRFSVRGTNRRVVFAFVPGDLALGVEAGPAGLRGQMGYLAAQAAGQIGEL